MLAGTYLKPRYKWITGCLIIPASRGTKAQIMLYASQKCKINGLNTSIMNLSSDTIYHSVSFYAKSKGHKKCFRPVFKVHPCFQEKQANQMVTKPEPSAM